MATPAAFSMGAPPPDASVATQIEQQATQAEQDVVSQAPAGATAAAQAGPPGTIVLGQTMDQVAAILGQPKNIVDRA